MPILKSPTHEMETGPLMTLSMVMEKCITTSGEKALHWHKGRSAHSQTDTDMYSLTEVTHTSTP